MKSDFEQWLDAQVAETGPFTIFILLIRIAGETVTPLKSSYAHMIGDEMTWHDMRALLDSAGAAWDGVAFYVGLDFEGGPLPDLRTRPRLRNAYQHRCSRRNDLGQPNCGSDGYRSHLPVAPAATSHSGFRAGSSMAAAKKAHHPPAIRIQP